MKKVKVLGKDYKITEKTPKDCPNATELFLGLCYREEGIIWIKPNMSNEQKMRTLLHEVGHAVFYRSGISFSGMIPCELEEILVEVNSNVFYEIFRDFIKDCLKENDLVDIKNRLQTFL